MAVHRLSPADLASRNRQVIRLYRQGIPAGCVGLRYGLSAGQVGKILRRAGGKTEKQGRQDYLDSFSIAGYGCLGRVD